MALSLTEFLASLPTMVGYQLDDDHVQVVELTDDRRMSGMMTVQWDTATLTEQELAEEVAATAVQTISGQGATDLFLIGYGPEGPDRTGQASSAWHFPPLPTCHFQRR